MVLVPAFTGMSAHWDSEARGAIFGLTRNSGPADARGMEPYASRPTIC